LRQSFYVHKQKELFDGDGDGAVGVLLEIIRNLSEFVNGRFGLTDRH